MSRAYLRLIEVTIRGMATAAAGWAFRRGARFGRVDGADDGHGVMHEKPGGILRNMLPGKLPVRCAALDALLPHPTRATGRLVPPVIGIDVSGTTGDLT